jgi:hypothetical protein
MQVYSQTIFSFIRRCEQKIAEIIEAETIFRMNRSRFAFESISYPIQLLVFEGSHKVAYFDPVYLQIGLNKKLIYLAHDKILFDILRHELAHYFTFIVHGDNGVSSAHGIEFQEICKACGWGADIVNAQINLETAAEKIEGNLASEKILTRIKNLLSLASSSNIHEAELATQKANELLLRYNLDHTNIEHEQDEFYVEQLCRQTKASSKLRCISNILKHFLVKPILSFGRKTVSLEVTGTKLNIELAQYLYDFLDKELEKSWLQTKKEKNYKGVQYKNAFYQGVSRGFEDKMKTVSSKLNNNDKNALILIKNDLDKKFNQVYTNLRSSRSTISSNEALNDGYQKGKTLTINKGIAATNNVIYKLE